MRKKKTRHTLTDQQAYESLLAGYSKSEIARLLGVSKQAITRWDTVPLKYVTRLSESTGIPKAHLRPSDFA